MAKSSAMLLLREQAEKALDEATRLLGQARTAWRQAQEQLEQLIGYEQEYRQQFQHSLAKGMTCSDMLNFNIFIENLDAAIRLRRQEVLRREQTVQQIVTSWQQKKRRLNAFEILVERAENQHQKQLNRLDQKLMDEFAQRAGLRNEGT